MGAGPWVDWLWHAEARARRSGKRVRALIAAIF
jgi:hypothetical protein